MQDETKERWKTLCEQAATEEDSRKLIQLVQEINDLLEEKRARLRKKETDERRGDELIAQGDTP
jgi:hypothetical protein